jgi:Cu/Ag efflux pump CusA
MVAMLALPVALSGALLAVFVTGGDFTLGSLAGCFAVLGLAARHAILLMGRYRALDADDAERSQIDLAIGGARERLPSVILTSAALIVGFLPFLVLGSIAGLELIQPMAIAVIGGAITTAAVTLLALPTLYVRFAPGAERARAAIPVAQPTIAS